VSLVMTILDLHPEHINRELEFTNFILFV